MIEVHAFRSATLGAACLALLGAALAGVAIGMAVHKPSASQSSPVPTPAQTAQAVPAAAASSPTRARLRIAVTQLDGVRRLMREQLAGARTAGERARAAAAIAAAYRAAAMTLAPLQAQRVAQSMPTVALVRLLWRDYEALGTAATANAAADFAATGRLISEHERALVDALGRWEAAN
jgi:hypothetical protein